MRWEIVYDEVRRRHAAWSPCSRSPVPWGWLVRRCAKYASAETFPARLPHGAGPSLLGPHVVYLVGRIDEGCETAMALWREIRERGYPGTSRQVHRFVAERRTRPVRSGRKPRSAKTSASTSASTSVSEPPGSEAPLPAWQLAWLLVQPISVLDEGEAAVVNCVEQDGTARAVTGLARRFTAFVCAAGKGKPVADDLDAAQDIEAWITQAQTCEAPAIATFASENHVYAIAILESRARNLPAEVRPRNGRRCEEPSAGHAVHGRASATTELRKRTGGPTRQASSTAPSQR